MQIHWEKSFCLPAGDKAKVLFHCFPSALFVITKWAFLENISLTSQKIDSIQYVFKKFVEFSLCVNTCFCVCVRESGGGEDVLVQESGGWKKPNVIQILPKACISYAKMIIQHLWKTLQLTLHLPHYSKNFLRPQGRLEHLEISFGERRFKRTAFFYLHVLMEVKSYLDKKVFP